VCAAQLHAARRRHLWSLLCIACHLLHDIFTYTPLLSDKGTPATVLLL